MYRILGTDQKEYGPVTGDDIRQWVSQGRVNGQTQALAEGDTAWRPLAAFPEFRDALAPGPAPPALPTASASTGRPAAGQQTGLAITSLMLGILSFFTCLITGIPAIITGHIAHSRARRQPAQFGGAGLAIAGLVLGYLGIAATFLVLPALLLPALAKAKAQAQRINCVSNLKQVGLAAHLYAIANKGVSPPDFLSMSSELGSPKILTCPADNSRVATAIFAAFDLASKHRKRVVLLVPQPVGVVAAQILLRCAGIERWAPGSVDASSLVRMQRAVRDLSAATLVVESLGIAPVAPRALLQRTRALRTQEGALDLAIAAGFEGLDRHDCECFVRETGVFFVVM